MKFKSAMKWTLIGGALSFVVLYGIEMSSSGIEQVYGPIEGEELNSVVVKPDVPANQSDKETDETKLTKLRIELLEKELAAIKRQAGLTEQTDEWDADESLNSGNDRLPGIPLEADQPPVNQLADSTSGLLQNMSSGGIRFVVSIFDGLTK